MPVTHLSHSERDGLQFHPLSAGTGRLHWLACCSALSEVVVLMEIRSFSRQGNLHPELEYVALEAVSGRLAPWLAKLGRGYRGVW